MVRITYAGISQHGVQYVEYAGLSTDPKPTDVATGSLFIEVDTGDAYFFNEDAEAGSEWIKVGGEDE